MGIKINNQGEKNKTLRRVANGEKYANRSTPSDIKQ